MITSPTQRHRDPKGGVVIESDTRGGSFTLVVELVSFCEIFYVSVYSYSKVSEAHVKLT